MKASWVGGVVCVLTVVAGVASLDRLPPSVSPVFLVPPLLAGIGLVMQSTAGRGLGTLGAVLAEDSWLHVPLVLLGWALVTVGALGLLRLPSAGTVAVVRLSSELPAVCTGPPPERVPLTLLPTLEALDSRLATQEGAVHAAGVAALRQALPRCQSQLERALRAPHGTHGSWGLLRRWMLAHPAYIEVDPEVAALPFRPRSHRPKRPSVQLDLSP